MIRSEQPSDRDGIESLIAAHKSSFGYTESLRKNNAQNAEMSLVYLLEGGISGYFCCTDSLNKDMKCLILAGVFAENDDILREMTDELKRVCTEKGYDVIFALDRCGELYSNFGFSDAAKSAICPSDSSEGVNRLEFCCMRLNGSTEPKFTFVEYPNELGIDYCLPDHAFRSVITAEEYPKYVYGTRFFTRLLTEHSFFILAAVLAVVLYVKSGDTKYINLLLGALIMLGTSIARPIVFTVKHTKKLHKKGEDCEDQWLYFYPKHFCTANLQKGGIQSYQYKQYRYIYLKRDYIFLGTKNENGTMGGIYISLKNSPNKAEFISYLKERCPEAKIRY